MRIADARIYGAASAASPLEGDFQHKPLVRIVHRMAGRATPHKIFRWVLRRNESGDLQQFLVGDEAEIGLADGTSCSPSLPLGPDAERIASNRTSVAVHAAAYINTASIRCGSRFHFHHCPWADPADSGVRGALRMTQRLVGHIQPEPGMGRDRRRGGQCIPTVGGHVATGRCCGDSRVL